MQGIKAWAAANPGKLQDALSYNASYVFFRELPAVGGPIGALNIALIAEYSLAVEPALRAARCSGVSRQHLPALGGAPRAPHGGA